MRRKAVILAVILMIDAFLAAVCVMAAADFDGRRNGRGSGSLPAGAGADRGLQADGGNSVQPASGEKLLALTFDDGPHAVYTKKLLDGLRERNVKATFFLVGENIPGNEALVRRMAEDGHLIGTHCYSHVDLTKEAREEACDEILKTNDLIESITGKRPEYIRPPYGSWSGELADSVEMTPVFWDIDTLDWKSQNTGAVLKHICRNVGKHQVILLHDVFGTSVDAALAAVDALTERGYTFVTVDELLID